MANKILESFLRERPSIRERMAHGRSLRQQTPRSSLGQFVTRSRRRSPVTILRAQAASRIPDLIPIRHARMSVNPFAFYRGGAAIMAHDLAPLPSPQITVQLCGDMHVSNFGFFATAERHLVFGINDFDETHPGNFDWDLKRLAASIMISSHELGQDRAYAESIIRLMSATYRTHMHQYATMPFVDLARSYIDHSQLLAMERTMAPPTLAFLKSQLASARKNTNQGVIGKLTRDTPLGRKLIDEPPLIMHLDKTYYGHNVSDVMDESLRSYAESLLSDRRRILLRYRLIDAARKVVGVGSVGTSCWILYLEGITDDDPLFLQFKQAQTSVLSPYFPGFRYRSQGERVAHGQRLIQGAPDIFLGYGQNRRAHFYMRQLRDMKGGISIGKGGIGVEEYPDYARLFGWALANAHARSGDPAVLAGYCGQGAQLDDALVQFSIAYAQQNAADYETFLKAIKDGKLPCATHNF